MVSTLIKRHKTLKSRNTIHKSAIRVRPNACALSMHTNQIGDNINFDNVTILPKEKNTFKRKFIEMAFIIEQKQSN